jgi:hypothetical protein
MKPRTLLVAFLFASSAVWAQSNPAEPANGEQAPAVAKASEADVAANTAAPAAAGAKTCLRKSGFHCPLKDQSLEPGATCMCGDKHGVVSQ